jgi:hypothetical protein
MEEALAMHLRTEIYSEEVRAKAESPAVETYESFRMTLADGSRNGRDPAELRRAFASLLDQIVLDPHGKDGVWCFTVHLKGASKSVEIVCRPDRNKGTQKRL